MMEEVEFIEIAARCGLPAPGMVLADENVHEMVDHCRGVLKRRADKLKIYIPDNGTVVPIFLKDCVLRWRPVSGRRCSLAPASSGPPSACAAP